MKRPTEWMLNIFPVPYPGLTDAPASYIDAWRRYIDPDMHVTPDADREDWLEQAARLEAGIRLLDNPILNIHGREARRMDGSEVPVGELASHPYFGEVTNLHIRDSILPELGNAHRYYLSPVVRSMLLRRHTALAPMEPQAIREAVRSMAVWGCDVVVKYVLREKALPIERIPRDEADSFDAMAWADWELIRFEDEPDAVLVQQRVDMRREYRMFVIDGTPVCGAGCVERCTPADNEATFDPKLEEHRNDGHVIRDKRTVNAYRDFAEQAAGMIRTEGFVQGPYVMDLATVDGRPCVVELNRMTNAGLYALDMDTLVTEANKHPEQFTLPAARMDAEPDEV